MSKPKNTAVKDTDIDSQRRCQKGSMGHTHWEFSAPVLRAAYSTPTQHPLWAVTMITQIHGTDIVIWKSCMIMQVSKFLRC